MRSKSGGRDRLSPAPRPSHPWQLPGHGSGDLGVRGRGREARSPLREGRASDAELDSPGPSAGPQLVLGRRRVARPADRNPRDGGGDPVPRGPAPTRRAPIGDKERREAPPFTIDPALGPGGADRQAILGEMEPHQMDRERGEATAPAFPVHRMRPPPACPPTRRAAAARDRRSAPRASARARRATGSADTGRRGTPRAPAVGSRTPQCGARAASDAPRGTRRWSIRWRRLGPLGTPRPTVPDGRHGADRMCRPRRRTERASRDGPLSGSRRAAPKKRMNARPAYIRYIVFWRDRWFASIV